MVETTFKLIYTLTKYNVQMFLVKLCILPLCPNFKNTVFRTFLAVDTFVSRVCEARGHAAVKPYLQPMNTQTTTELIILLSNV